MPRRKPETIVVGRRIFHTRSGRTFLVVEAPDPMPQMFPEHYDLNHSLLRPYHLTATTGKPVVGSVQYEIIQIPGRTVPQVLAAVALRDSRIIGSGRLLPGNIFLFPGMRFSRRHSRADMSGFIHHFSIRELSRNRVEVNVNMASDTDDQADRLRRGQSIEVPPDCEILHLAQLFVKDASAFDEVGRGLGAMTDGAKRALDRRNHLSDDMGIRNHPFLSLEADPAIADQPNYLWAAWFVVAKLLTDEQINRLLWFFLRKLPEQEAKGARVNLDFEGAIQPYMISVDLGAIRPGSRFPYLLTMVCVVPGTMEHHTSVVGFPQDLTEIVAGAPNRGNTSKASNNAAG